MHAGTHIPLTRHPKTTKAESSHRKEKGKKLNVSGYQAKYNKREEHMRIEGRSKVRLTGGKEGASREP